MPEDVDPSAQRATLADAFDSAVDPLADAAATFEATDVDPFAIYLEESIRARDLARSTERQFASLFAEWQSFMADQGRHPACPSPEHVLAYIDWQTRPDDEAGRGNTNRTVTEKLRKLSQAYRYWQQDAAFPHPEGYNPFYLARQRASLTVTKNKEHRRIPIAELQEMVASVTDLRARAIIAMQLKLGLRAGEVANCRLGDLRLEDAERPRTCPRWGVTSKSPTGRTPSTCRRNTNGTATSRAGRACSRSTLNSARSSTGTSWFVPTPANRGCSSPRRATPN